MDGQQVMKNKYSNRTSNQQSLNQRLESALEKRRQSSTLRSLDLPSISPSQPSFNSIGGKKEQSTTNQQFSSNQIDFSSNDYLGLAHSKRQLQKVNTKYHSCIQQQEINNNGGAYLGSTGSRLLSGNSQYAVQLEKQLAQLHSPTSLSTQQPTADNRQNSALLFNSGYDANLSILSSIPIHHDYILLDELVHNSLVMGVRMSRLPQDQVWTFAHNDVSDLHHKLSLLSTIIHNGRDEEDHNQMGHIIIVVESVYSMDGDVAPLHDILDLALMHNAKVVVDEAHGLGVFGKSNVHHLQLQQKSQLEPHSSNGGGGGGTGVLAALNLESHMALLAAVYTFGKAAGCHGAVVIAQNVVIRYLINYARPFVYSTSLPLHSLCSIQCAYETMISHDGDLLREQLFLLVNVFRDSFNKKFPNQNTNEHDPIEGNHILTLLRSHTPVQAVLCKGNERCVRVAKKLQQLGEIHVYPIRSPTVPIGEERIRIIIHAHNTEDEVLHLVSCFKQVIMNEYVAMKNRRLHKSLPMKTIRKIDFPAISKL